MKKTEETKKIQVILEELFSEVSTLFPSEKVEAYLYGSYARGEAEEDSDVDVLFLVESSRDRISTQNWKIGDIASEMLLKHGVLVSPIVENRLFFEQNVQVLPYFRNIQQEGVPISA